jgi:hypothetical protein
VNSTEQDLESARRAMAASMSAVDDYSRRSLEANSRKITPIGDATARAYAGDPDQLANDSAPNHIIDKEQPHHVLMCYMLAGGKSRQEIATATGYSYQSVCQVVRQPWFRKRFLALAREAGQDEVQAFIKAETLNSLDTLVQVRDDKASPPAVRVASARELLDRALGKSVQHVKSESEINITRAAAEGMNTEKELEHVEAELKARGISPSVGPN